MPTETATRGPPTLPMMRITGALPEDVDDVALLLTAQFNEHSIAFDESFPSLAIRGAIEQPSRGEFLAAHDRASDHERPIGLAYLAYIWTLEHGGQCAWLEELFVTPGARSRGVGSALLREAMARALARGYRAMDLEIDADHARAANLYVRAGFQPSTYAPSWPRRTRVAMACFNTRSVDGASSAARIWPAGPITDRVAGPSKGRR